MVSSIHVYNAIRIFLDRFLSTKVDEREETPVFIAKLIGQMTKFTKWITATIDFRLVSKFRHQNAHYQINWLRSAELKAGIRLDSCNQFFPEKFLIVIIWQLQNIAACVRYGKQVFLVFHAYHSKGRTEFLKPKEWGPWTCSNKHEQFGLLFFSQFLDHFPKVLHGSFALVKPYNTRVLPQILHIDNSLSTDNIVKFFIVEHKETLLVDGRSEALANEASLVFEQFVDFICSQ